MEKRKINNAAAFKKMGAFTPTKAIVKTIPMIDPDNGEECEVDIFVKKQSFGAYGTLLKEGDTASSLPGALLISKSLFEDEDCRKPLLTYDQAYGLEPTIAMNLFNAIREVNEGVNASGKKSPSTQETNSSTSLSLPESVGEQSTSSETT